MQAGAKVLTAFDQIAGWRDDDHSAALACLRLSARHILSSSGSVSKELAFVLRKALDHADASAVGARRFFEESFEPVPMPGNSGGSGFVTGYYEPVVRAAKSEHGRYRFPLYAPPPGLGSQPHLTRAEIRLGALAGKGLELAWLESKIDQFFVHIQGSANLQLPDGTTMRVGFAAKNGHPYTPIGRILVEAGDMSAGDVTMDSIRGWLAQNPGKADAVMDENRSYIFFRVVEPANPDLGPVGASGVQLTPGRSLAADPVYIPFGLPVWLATHEKLPDQSSPFRRLMIAQDAGSAITGPARGDIFVGAGKEAGSMAGNIKHDADFLVLQPRRARG